MTLARTPLDTARLSPAAQRALAPGPTRLMAARGLAPLADPVDLVTVLYQLGLDSDTVIQQAAVATASELPERVLGGALSDERLDPRVLDYFAERVLPRPALLQRVVLNRATSDQTMAWLAGRADPALVDLIAQNEQRLLGHPEIVSAMFHNPRARMSTVDRAIELAVRNQVKVAGIPSWDALAASIVGASRDAGAAKLSDQEADAIFARVAETADNAARSEPGDTAKDTAASEQNIKAMPISSMSVPQKIRLATLGNAFSRAQLIRDPTRVVSTAAIKAPGVSDVEAAKYASNHSLSDDVIKHIAGRRDWTKSYGVKLALVQNPKTPIPDAVRFMPHLRERDLRNIARSKNVPTAVVAQARKLIMKRGAKQKK